MKLTRKDRKRSAWKAQQRERAAQAPKYTYSAIRAGLDRIAAEENEYAGLPMLVSEARIHLATSHPFRERLEGKSLNPEDAKADDGPKMECINEWHASSQQRDIYVWREAESANSRTGWVGRGPVDRLIAKVKCIGIALTMEIDAEERAMVTLATLIKPHMFNIYRMLGYFIETSKRSGVTYMFRRLAPTIAFRVGDDSTRYLASLCLHPLAYYEALPIGAMVPTDDVIAHLLLMRSDEHLFWKRSNQHGASSPGAAL